MHRNRRTSIAGLHGCLVLRLGRLYCSSPVLGAPACLAEILWVSNVGPEKVERGLKERSVD